MTVVIFFLGLVQCFLIWSMNQAGRGLQQKAAEEHEAARTTPPGGWPVCGLIIPVSGSHPQMEMALRSLLNQDYPAFVPCIVTATAEDEAMGLIESLKDDFPRLIHVVAGLAENRGQKNHNLLAGVDAIRDAVDIFVFCDSTHIAEADFMRCLVHPIARGETAFTTGYHQVYPGDIGSITLGYAMSVLFMRLLQGMAIFTQPWGGASAIKKSAWEHYHIAELWQNTVVDDCVLAAWLQKKGVHIYLCPAALLKTIARGHSFSSWRAWMERQILFLKFCIPAQWVALGVLCVFMILPPLWCVFCLMRGLIGLGGGMAPFLALCWLWLITWAVNKWRDLLQDKIGYLNWVWAFFCACAMFCLAYARTICSRKITWQNIVYNVGRHGKVKSINR